MAHIGRTRPRDARPRSQAGSQVTRRDFGCGAHNKSHCNHVRTVRPMQLWLKTPMVDFSTGAQIVLVLFAVASWRRAQNTKLADRKRMFSVACSAYYILAAATIFLSRVSLAL